jgi:uncharacterized protein YecE (DUF72 family)
VIHHNARCWIGTSGWNYPHWSGVFYPRELKPVSWFQHYAKFFDTVELNNTFYRLPKPRSLSAGAKRRFCLLNQRFITHEGP